ncbi:hypothetical protein H0H87_008105 [Tephrocybe sp. NHM501043]|nr:hypothetical protein H0H87_008105 [Tephrocybe sp. NHM501043]
MNISGPSIAAACRRTVQSPSSMIVISDSLSHKVETMHARLGGSANGHNGVKSIISALGNDLNFHRFRIGIGRDDTDAATYVLRKLSSHERRFWGDEGLDLVLSEIEKIAPDGSFESINKGAGEETEIHPLFAMFFSRTSAALTLALALSASAQPSPDLQKRISAAIKAAANQPNPDLTAFVNPFIGTG